MEEARASANQSLNWKFGQGSVSADWTAYASCESKKSRTAGSSRSSAAPAFSEWSSLGQDRIGCIMPEAITGHFLLTPQKHRSSSRLRNPIFHHELNPFSRVTALPRDSFHACHNRTFVGSQDRFPTRVHSGSLPFAQSWRERNLLLESGSMGGRSFLSLSPFGQSFCGDRRTS